MTLTKSDFTKICRMCLLVKKELSTLQIPEVVEMIITCIGIEIKFDDGLPQTICLECSDQMYKYSKFRQRCKNSDKILHKIMNEDDNYDSLSDVSDRAISPKITKELEEDVKKEPFDIERNIKKITQSFLYQTDKISPSNKVVEIVPILPIKKELEEIPETQNSVKIESILEEDDSHIKEENINKSSSNIDDHENTLKNKKQLLQEVNSTIPKNNILENGSKKKTKKLKQLKLECDQCFKEFRKPCELAKHLNDIHKREKTVECQVCSRTFYLQIQLESHLKIHFKMKHTCNVCGREFGESSKLRRHQKIHKNREKIFCIYCHKSFISDDYFKTHEKLCKNRRKGQGIKEKKTCPVCGKVVVNVRTHIKQIHNQNKDYKCDQCDKSYIFNYLLTRHVQEKHLGVKKELKALCFKCGKACLNQGELKKHLSTHEDNREFKCNLCNKKYKSRDGLQFHLKTHKGIRPYECSVCSKKYFTKNHLQQHLYSHNGERPYACHICGRTFSYKASRWTHMKVHNVFIESNKITDVNV